MKLWFIEVRPNVFISGIKDTAAKKIVSYLFKYCSKESGLMVFKRIRRAPGYEIFGIGDTKRSLIELSGLQLVVEN